MDNYTRPSIAHGIMVALALSAAALAGAALFSFFIYGYLLLKLLVGGVAFLYICILLHEAKGQSGRVVLAVLSAAVLATTMVWFSLQGFVLSAVALVWMVRSLTTYSSVLFAGVDGMLCACGLLAASWAMFYSGSVIAAVWCFFLVQSLYVLIPRSIGAWGKGTTRADKVKAAEHEAFDAAYQAAEEILRTAGSAVR